MLRVLILDRSNPVFYQWVRGLAKTIVDLDVRIIFVSDKEESASHGNLEIVNVFDGLQDTDLETLERKAGFSLHKALVPERSFFDYSSFRKCQTYSGLTIEKIGRTIRPYLNTLDYVIREKADVVLEALTDNFMTSLATRLARFYGKPFYMAYAYYWWSDGLFFVDRVDQTSSEIDRRYRHYRQHPGDVDRVRVDKIFSQKRATLQFPGRGIYPLGLRLRQLWARRKSYEPISWSHWICRRLSGFVSRMAIRARIPQHRAPYDEDFILFPLHVSPEATLLGSEPEFADQFSLLKNISMNLPFGVRLYVKEHPAQFLGNGLDYGFYRRLTALPNVRYYRADASLKELMSHRRCLGVAVINGTVGLEAAMNRKPVFVFGRALYGAGDCFLKPKSFDEFYARVQKIRGEGYTFDDQALYAILQALDDTVVRADVDIARSKTWTELALSCDPIYRALLNQCLARHSADRSGRRASGNE